MSAAEALSRGRGGQSFQMAEHNWLSVSLWKSRDLLVQRSQMLGVSVRYRGTRRRELASASLMKLPRDRRISRPSGHTQRDSKEPTGQRVALSDRTCSAQEHQERGLEGVLGVVRIVEHLPANVQDHGPVTLDQ